jgi:hypothetical protein
VRSDNEPAACGGHDYSDQGADHVSADLDTEGNGSAYSGAYSEANRRPDRGSRADR